MNGFSGRAWGPQTERTIVPTTAKRARFMRRLLPHAVLAVAVAVLLQGCIDEKGQFIFGRVADRCNTEWPICDTIAGCLLGDSSYIEGKFPTTGKVGVQLFEPSTVTVSFFLENVAGAGEETGIDFFEDRGRARVRVAIEGKTFVGESEQSGGVVTRHADLSGIGDHLIQYTSDARLKLLMKVDVLPLRLKDMGTDQTGSM